jgi:hypothetical protein
VLGFNGLLGYKIFLFANGRDSTRADLFFRDPQ